MDQHDSAQARAVAVARLTPIGLTNRERPLKVGSFPAETTRFKDRIDFLLTRVPAIYLSIELRRQWINWDKRLYLALVRRGDVVLDVGANIGTHTVFLSHLVGRSGRVVAFEPIPESFARLEKKIRERARFRNVTAVRTALGAATRQSRTMQIPGDDVTRASLAAHHADAWTADVPVTNVEVPASTLDAQAVRFNLHHVDLVKVDVEGAELEVLEGARETIGRFKPLIYCEVYESWVKSFGYTPGDLFSFLASLGYGRARIFHGDQITAIPTTSEPPGELFSSSADVLFYADRHAKRVRSFDHALSVTPSRDESES